MISLIRSPELTLSEISACGTQANPSDSTYA